MNPYPNPHIATLLLEFAPKRLGWTAFVHIPDVTAG